MEEFLSGLEDLEKTDLVEKYAKLLNMTVRLNRKLRGDSFEESFYLYLHLFFSAILLPSVLQRTSGNRKSAIYNQFLLR